MKRLDKTQKIDWTNHQKSINEARNALEQAIEKFNIALAANSGPVQAALEVLNEAVVNADTWRGEIADAMEEYAGERSDNWQESDAGSTYRGWIDEWSNELEQIDLDLPEPLEVPDCEAADALEQLPETPE